MTIRRRIAMTGKMFGTGNETIILHTPDKLSPKF